MDRIPGIDSNHPVDLSVVTKSTLLYNIHYPDFNNMRLGTALLSGYLQTSGYRRIRIQDIPCVRGLYDDLPRESSIRAILDRYLSMDLDSIPAIYDLLVRRSNGASDIVGFSLMGGLDIAIAVTVARIIKSIRPETFIVWGGPLVTVHTETLLSNGSLARYVDGLVTGYGEKPLAYLIAELEGTRELNKVPNLLHSDGRTFHASSWVCAPDPAYLRTLPDFSDFQGARCLPLRLSMGCYWGKCAFCIYRRAMMHNTQYHYLPPEEAVSLIEAHLKEYGVSDFEFLDDGPHPDFLKRFSEILLSREVAVSWSTFLCLDQRFEDRALTHLMKAAGCRAVALGLESVVDSTLIKMHKMQTAEQIRPVLESFRSAGIEITLNIIVGFPGETPEEFQRTLDFLLDSKYLYDDVQISPYGMDKNDDVYENPEEFGVASVDKRDYVIEICPEGHLKKEISVGYRYQVEGGISMKDAYAMQALVWTLREAYVQAMGEEHPLRAAERMPNLGEMEKRYLSRLILSTDGSQIPRA